MARVPICLDWKKVSWNKASRNKESGSRAGRAGAFGILVLLLFGLLAANIGLGSVRIPVSELARILAGKLQGDTHSAIVWQIRFPRAVAAAVLGGGLALSGYLLQTFFQNPIAGPFVLGISSGAKLAVALTLVGLLRAGLRSSSLVLIGAAFAGALISMGAVLVLSKSVPRSAMLIVSGVMIGYICSAITDFVVAFAEDSDIVNLHNWSMGSFSGITWEHVGVLTAITMSATAAVFLLSKPIGACQMGESYAASMGVSVARLRVSLVLLSSLLAACVTAFAGPVSFVGIAVPQLARYGFRTAKPMVLIPACFLGGAVFCLFSDLTARLLFAPVELSISSVTALFGAPVVIGVMVRRRKGQQP